MRRFVEGADRGQNTLFPECLEDWIGEDNPVRVIDVFVDELELAELGLGSTTDCRPRRALLHLSYSCIPPCGPAILVTQDPLADIGALGTLRCDGVHPASKPKNQEDDANGVILRAESRGLSSLSCLRGADHWDLHRYRRRASDRRQRVILVL